MRDIAELHAQALDAAGRVVAGIAGPVPGSVSARHWFIHGWDLAAVTGQDTTLDAGLMRACREVLEQLEAFGAAGPQTRFLAMLGRAG